MNSREVVLNLFDFFLLVSTTVSQPWKHPNTTQLQTRPNKTHVNQLIILLVEMPIHEMDGSDKRDIQTVYCWGAFRNKIGKH